MFIAVIKDGNIDEIGSYKDIFPNTSFGTNGPSTAWLVQNNCKVVNTWKLYDAATQKLQSTVPYIEDDKVYLVSVADKTTEELSADSEHLGNLVRSQRDKLLRECDWTQLSDSVVDKQAWAAYRKALRNITSQEEFPTAVVFPDRPQE